MLVATWNVNGIRAREAQFLEWIARDAPDVVCLQETKATRDQVPTELSGLGDYWSYWHESVKGYSGVSLHLRKATFPERPVFRHPPHDMESRLVETEIGDLVIASLYMPNGGKNYEAKLQFLEQMVTYAEGVRNRGKHLLLSGDMNVTRSDMDVHKSQRNPQSIGQRKDERWLFERMIAADLVDTVRELHPEDDKLFTWWPYWRDAKKKNTGWRIDYVFVSKQSKLVPTEARILADVGTSDHAPVLVRFSERTPAEP